MPACLGIRAQLANPSMTKSCDYYQTSLHTPVFLTKFSPCFLGYRNENAILFKFTLIQHKTIRHHGSGIPSHLSIEFT